MNVFCNQCGGATEGGGCEKNGVCGKDVDLAHLQNLLVAWLKQVATAVARMRQIGRDSTLVDDFLLEAVASLLPGASLDRNEVVRCICMADRMYQLADHLAYPDNLPWKISLEEQAAAPLEELSPAEIDQLVEQGKEYGVHLRLEGESPASVGLQELLFSAIVGAASFVCESRDVHRLACDKLRYEIAGMQMAHDAIKPRDIKERPHRTALKNDIAAGEKDLTFQQGRQHYFLEGLWSALATLAADPEDPTLLLDEIERFGKLNTEILDNLEWSRKRVYGVPEPVVVRLTPEVGKCILVSGDDMGELARVLEATRNKDVNVFTHGELLSAHAYPAFRKYPHLAGHYGTSWQRQKKEFGAFPGAILMTSGPVMTPDESYQDYIFTRPGLQVPGLRSLTTKANGTIDYQPLLQASWDSSGFFRSKNTDRLTVGFGVDAIERTAETIRKSISQRYLRYFFVLGGSDTILDRGEYFADFARDLPPDCMILAFGDVKFRFNRLELAPLGSGFPRLFDLGQLSDASGVIRLLQFLTSEFGYDLVQLPLSVSLSWFGPRSSAVLLSFLSLGLRSVSVGPVPPPFFYGGSGELLAKRFGLQCVSSVSDDLSRILGPGVKRV